MNDINAPIINAPTIKIKNRMVMIVENETGLLIT